MRWALLILLIGCGTEVDLVLPTEGAQTFVVATPAPEAQVFSRVDLPIERTDDDDAEVFITLFEESIDDLALIRGVQQEAAADEPFVSLPEPQAVFRSFDGDLSLIEEVPEWLRDFRFPRESSCPELEVRFELPVDDDTWLELITPGFGGRTLVFSRTMTERRLWEVDTQGTITAEMVRPFSASAAALTPDGSRLFVSGVNASGFAVELVTTSSTVRLPRRPDPPEQHLISWMAAEQDGTLYTLSNRMRLHRYDGVWTELFDGAASSFDTHGGIGVLDDGTVLVYLRDQGEQGRIFRQEGDQQILEPVQAVATLSNLQAFGDVAVMGDGFGRLYIRRQEGVWVEYIGSPAASRVRDVERYRDWLVVGHEGGELIYFDLLTDSFCPLNIIDARFEVRFLARAGDGVFVGLRRGPFAGGTPPFSRVLFLAPPL